jgi:hypothetical protein
MQQNQALLIINLLCYGVNRQEIHTSMSHIQLPIDLFLAKDAAEIRGDRVTIVDVCGSDGDRSLISSNYKRTFITRSK